MWRLHVYQCNSRAATHLFLLHPLSMGMNSERKEFAPFGANSFLSEYIPFGRVYESTKVRK